MTATCSGVAATSPWPIEKFAASPARTTNPLAQFSPATCLR